MGNEDRGYDGSHRNHHGDQHANDWSGEANQGGYAARAQQHYAHQPAADADVDSRIAFIRRTYAHLAGAIAAFVGLEAVFFATGVDQMLIPLMLGGPYSWLIVLALFMGGGWIANSWAMSDRSPGLQYLGLGAYVVLEAVIFLPLLAIAAAFSNPSVIPIAGLITLIVFGAMTAVVFISKQDFSFLRIGLTVASFLAIGGIIAAIIFGVSLGLWFSIFMVGLASAYILYYTSNVLHHYHTGQHVAASLALFSAVALLFWYVLTLVMSFSE